MLLRIYDLTSVAVCVTDPPTCTIRSIMHLLGKTEYWQTAIYTNFHAGILCTKQNVQVNGRITAISTNLLAGLLFAEQYSTPTSISLNFHARILCSKQYASALISLTNLSLPIHVYYLHPSRSCKLSIPIQPDHARMHGTLADRAVSQYFHKTTTMVDLYYLNGNTTTMFEFDSQEDAYNWQWSVSFLKSRTTAINDTHPIFNAQKGHAFVEWLNRYNAFVRQWTLEKTPDDIVAAK